MKNIFDPVGLWLGKPPLALNAGNKRPVVLDDTLFVVMDSGSTNINVLANDFDPEGRPITLVSANAALGTAVAEANETVSYTPPPGISGFDTVTYTVADDIGQENMGQVNITIVEPGLSITTTAQNTLVINADTGVVDLTINNPATFTGSYQVATADLLTGPVNLAPPVIIGTVATGQTLTATPGLWAYEVGAGDLTQSFQWRRGGSDIPGATDLSYVVAADDIGEGISVIEVQSDSNGQRLAQSATMGIFQPTDDTALIGWWDADDAATLTADSGLVSSWADKAGTVPITQTYGPERPISGQRTLNGRNVLDFDGTKVLESNMNLPTSGNVAFHMALVVDNSNNAFAAVFAVDATNDFQIDAEDGATFNGRLNAAGIGSSVSFSGGPFSGPVILSAVFDRTGNSTAEIYVNDELRGQTGYTTAIDPSVVMTLMTNRSQNANINGAVAELVVTGDVSNRALYQSYLADKWGLS